MVYLEMLNQNFSENLSEENIKFNEHQSGYIRELINKYKTLLCFGNFEFEKKKYINLITENYNLNTNTTFLGAIFFNSSFFLNFLMNGLVVLVGSRIILYNLNENIFGNVEAGQILSIILLLITVQFYSKDILINLNTLSQGIESARNFYNLKNFSQSQKLKLHESQNDRTDKHTNKCFGLKDNND